MRIAGSQPVAHYAERKERRPKVAIFDGFAEPKQPPEHGDSVEKVVLSTTALKDKDVQNYQTSYKLATSYEQVYEAPAPELRAAMTRLAEETFTGFFQATARNLDDVVERGTIRVVNQSQSQCAARLARPFIEKMEKDESFRLKVKEAFGLPVRAHFATTAEAFLQDVQSTIGQNPKIGRARKDYLRSAKRAHDHGVVHVVTAGNLGKLAKDWEEKGIQVPKDAYRSLFATEYATVVGATDSRGTTTVRDDRAAAFTSIHAGAEFSMHGVNVEVLSKEPNKASHGNGTSFAAPQLTGLISNMLEVNPRLGVAEVENLLTAASIPVQAKKEEVGAGQIDPDRALYLAFQTAYIAKA